MTARLSNYLPSARNVKFFSRDPGRPTLEKARGLIRLLAKRNYCSFAGLVQSAAIPGTGWSQRGHGGNGGHISGVQHI
jgi:hypothetical protein